jgi:hypothetical protein
MKINENGIVRDMTDEEIAAVQAENERAEREYWTTVSYGSAVDAEIRRRYSVSEEFAILRQKDEKPAEYDVYYAYCEECKKRVKEMMVTYGNDQV